MKEFYSGIQRKRMEGESSFINSTNVRYGRQEDVKGQFDAIVKTEDEDIRHGLIDKLISKMEKNCEANSFFPSNETIHINQGSVGQGVDSPRFKIDDKDLYYMFFDIYGKLQDQHPEASDSQVHYHAVKDTVRNYFGRFNGDKTLRESLTTPDVDYDKFVEDPFYEPEAPSISSLRGQNCAMCVENASVSHNLWLLGGYESYCVRASSIDFKDLPDEAHSYCLINYNNKFKLFDPSMQKYPAFATGENPAEDILNGEPLIIDNMVYANALNLEQNIDEPTE